MKTETVELVRIPEIETGDLEWEGLGIVEKAQQIPAIIPDDQTYEQCGLLIVEAGQIKKKIVDRFEKEKTGRYLAHKMVCDLENALTAFPIKALQIAEPKRHAYEKEEKRKQQEREAELQHQAKKQEEDKRVTEAEYFDALGETEYAEKILDQPIEPPLVILGPAVPKIKGLRAKPPNWGWKLIDAKLVPDSYWMLDKVKIGRIVRATGMECDIPGIRVYDKNDSAG